jgi:8-hydroxy-5-deazaflavin:NADPH oxidoreductase
MKIAVIGMGNVGGALGRRWAAGGHNIVFGIRDADDPKHQSEATAAGVRVTGVREAVAGADVVALTVPWGAVPDALTSAGDLSGKVLLDCTNPVTPDVSALQLGMTTSAGEEVAKRAPGAKVVKIFNTTGAGNMADTNYGPSKPTMLYAGDDAVAKAVAARLASELGFDPVELGPLSTARLLEPLALTWITLAIRRQLGKDFVFQIVRRPGK